MEKMSYRIIYINTVPHTLPSSQKLLLVSNVPEAA